MEAILFALEEEKKQAHHLIKKYKKEFKKLPQGTFFVRNVGKNRYGYLTSSKKGKIQQKYLGRLSKEEILQYRDMAKRKKKLQDLRSKAQKQLDFLEKSLRHVGKKSKRGA